MQEMLEAPYDEKTDELEKGGSHDTNEDVKGLSKDYHHRLVER